MTNGEKFKGAKERAAAFVNYCNKKEHCTHRNRCPKVLCAMEWLDLEVPAEKPLPCPFCGRDVHPFKAEIGYCVNCDHCGYVAGQGGYTMESAIAAHNRVARAAKEKEANDANA